MIKLEYVIVNVSDNTDMNGVSSRVINFGVPQTAPVTPGMPAMMPMTVFSHRIENPTADDLAKYKAGALMSVTIDTAPTV